MKALLYIALFTCSIYSCSEKLKESKTVDFAYSPPEWQTAICFPDDPYKSIVDKSGMLLYHFGKGKREFGTMITVNIDNNVQWNKQELYSPQIPIVKTYKSGIGLNVVEEAFSVEKPIRTDVVIIHVTNTSKEKKVFSPKLIVDTKMGIKVDGQKVMINNKEIVTSSLNITGFSNDKNLQLTEITVLPGKTVDFSICFSPKGDTVKEIPGINQAIKYWENTGLPFNKISIPDQNIQALISSSVRNIWQAREIKGGLPAFQVGPTVYRGLWIVDGAFLLETAAILGKGDEARNGIAYELSHQKADGRIDVMHDANGFWKESGIVLWTCVRHAMLTQDKKWLEDHWANLLKVSSFIHKLRTDDAIDTVLEKGLPVRRKHNELNKGLIPEGNIDGGIYSGVDYSNTYWSLIGLKSFIDAAYWIGKTDDASKLQAEFDDFFAVFQNAAKRDLTKDPFGNNYLPIIMGEAGRKELPQRAQWTFCHAVYPGELFPKNDVFVEGNMEMLKATEREGMVYGTGWDEIGIWNYFASFYGHSWLWQGNGRKAAEVLYAFANHSSPTLVWREEQSLKGEKFRKVGDMPHNWASAEFIRLTVHLLALERGNDLHLLEGIPAEWLGKGMETKLNGIQTKFGTVYMNLKVAEDGKSAKLSFKKIENCKSSKCIVHLKSLTGEDTTLEFSICENIDISLPINLK